MCGSRVDAAEPVYTPSDIAQGPEHLLAGSGLIDYDLLGRLYDQSQWRNAFGPGHLAEPVPPAQTDEAKAAADVGVAYNGAGALIFAYMNQVATLIQRSGPVLNPSNAERGMLTLPPAGGGRHEEPAQLPHQGRAG
jgi:hypothetical protein